MEFLELSVLGPRYIFVLIGFLVFSIGILKKQKDKVDNMPTSAVRKKEWKEYWRRNWENFPIAFFYGLILSTVVNVAVITWDAIKETDYNHIYSIKGVDLFFGFIFGWFGTLIMKKTYMKAKEKFDSE